MFSMQSPLATTRDAATKAKSSPRNFSTCSRGKTSKVAASEAQCQDMLEGKAAFRPSARANDGIDFAHVLLPFAVLLWIVQHLHLGTLVTLTQKIPEQDMFLQCFAKVLSLLQGFEPRQHLWREDLDESAKGKDEASGVADDAKVVWGLSNASKSLAESLANSTTNCHSLDFWPIPISLDCVVRLHVESWVWETENRECKAKRSRLAPFKVSKQT